MASLTIDNRTARRIFLDRHALADTPAGPGKGADLQDLITRLGFVQIDSVNTLARAHDMILYSRRPAYRPAALQRLHDRDRALFEHWTHDAAMIPMAFYPHWHLRFRRDADRLRARWSQSRRAGFEAQFQDVLNHIRTHGPVMSSDLGAGEDGGDTGWWDWRPSKTALEYLWRSGVLAVTGRSAFRKRFDLTERVIEEHLCPAAGSPDAADSIDWLCNAALDRLGFATSGEIAAFWATVSAAEARDWCAAEQAAGRLIPVDITCADGSCRKGLAQPDLPQTVPECVPPRLRVLSPFDPMLRDRARAERLFGFHYRIEIFVPEAKRRFGYYVFPLLEGDRMVGRVDMRARRDADELVVRALWPEPGLRWSKTRHARFEAELARVTRFAGLANIRFEDGWLRDGA
ncbi:MAG: winged helix DNA-binding domain-containing protein [Marinibacterium sp.]|nr:winged helix DNA-binding domain-containing protein [Marinibacterium sp.]